jgi:hypothetical protein
MFKLPNLPSSRAHTHELADFSELLAWMKGSASAREIAAYLGRLDENDNNVGCDDNSDESADTLDEVMNEIERREVACGNGYPFRLELVGTVVHLKEDAITNPRSLTYLYLLLSTRLNMRDEKIQAELDGTKLLEKISAHILKNYLGNSRAMTVVFGTAQLGGFEAKVKDICLKLGEGSGFRSLDGTPPQANDDRIDTVGWIPFSDKLPGQLIVFGQCKTGTEWRDSTTDLQPENFIKRWMQEPILVTPIRAFFVAEAADRARWKSDCLSAGIFFDRCRIVDCLSGMPIDEIQKWTLAAKDRVAEMIT